MALKAKVDPNFWDDAAIDGLDAGGKLAFLWLMSNSSRNNIGLSKVTRSKFCHETKLPWEALSSVLQVASKSLAYVERQQDVSILLKTFVRHQISQGQLKPANRLMTNVCELAAELPDTLREAFIQTYPSLLQGVSSVLNGEATSSHFKSQEQNGTEQNRTPSSSEAFSDDEVFTEAAAFPGEPASGAPGPMDPAWVATWIAKIRRRSGDPPRNWRAALKADWRVDFRTIGTLAGRRGKNSEKSAWELKQEAEELESQIAGHPANEQGSGWLGSCEAAERDDLVAKVRRFEEVRRLIGGNGG